MKRIIAAIIAVAFLAGCSANSLQKAEQNTRLTGMVVPGGAIIHLPIAVASAIANMGKPKVKKLSPEEEEAWRKGIEEAKKRQAEKLAAEEAASQPSQD